MSMTLHAQTFCPDSVGISTNPLPGKAYNNERDPDTTTSFRNTFNWMANPWPHAMSGAYLGQPALQSPFDGNNTQNIGYLQNGANTDYYPEDGWELVHWGMAFCKD